MTNSDKGESIFKDLLIIAIKDTFTPTEWKIIFHISKNKIKLDFLIPN
tara:strand:+ start:541 stop:684 length:144 start_codon:yes stop_codon:yes gene_type:complete